MTNPALELLQNCRIKPFDHQVIGVEQLVQRPFFLLADEMGAGKTKQAIDAAIVMFLMGVINKVLVVCPAPVRGVWFDPELGELTKHLWEGVNVRVIEFHATNRGWWHGQKEQKPFLPWIITNYDFIRRPDRLAQIKSYCSPKTLLILDESWAIKNHTALQTKACLILRRKCGRVVLLNGTPIANSPMDMYSQGKMMDSTILGCPTFAAFRSRYAVMGGWQGKVVVGWVNLEDLQKRFAPYVLRRLKEDCIDLPPKMPPVTLTVPMTSNTWGHYKEMRDEFVTWLGKEYCTAPQAIVKVMRLAQLTSGFLGGLQTFDEEDPEKESQIEAVRDVGREKLDYFLNWLDEQLLEDKLLKMVVFSRFRPEVERLYKALQDNKYYNVRTGLIWGNQKRMERSASLTLLDPRTSPSQPVVVIATPGAGAVGINLSAAKIAYYMSSDYSLYKRLQSDDRIHRPGQKSPVSYFDCVATGPQGQKTIDHIIIKAIRNKEEIAKWTTQGWVAALTEE